MSTDVRIDRDDPVDVAPAFERLPDEIIEQ
jgi:hypothetical protein